MNEGTSSPSAGPTATFSSVMAGEGAPERSREIHFPQGLPGFPGTRRYRLDPLPESAGFLWLQAVEEPWIRFLVTPYLRDGLPLGEEAVASACALLGLSPCDALILLVASVERDGGRLRIHVNLRAPIFIDCRSRCGSQQVLPDPTQPVRHLLHSSN